MRVFLSISAGFLVIMAIIPYILSIIQGKTRPSKATWIVFALLAMVTAVAMYQAQTLNVQIATIALGNLIIAGLSFKYGMPGWTRVEQFSLGGAALGMGVWIITQNPLHAILIALAVNVAGVLPTLIKTWKFPELESKSAWIFFLLSSFCQLLATPEGSLTALLQPLVYFGTHLIMVGLIFRPR